MDQSGQRGYAELRETTPTRRPSQHNWNQQAVPSGFQPVSCHSQYSLREQNNRVFEALGSKRNRWSLVACHDELSQLHENFGQVFRSGLYRRYIVLCCGEQVFFFCLFIVV